MGERQFSLPDRERPDRAGVGITLRGPATTWQLTSEPWGEAVATGLPADTVELLMIEAQEHDR